MTILYVHIWHISTVHFLKINFWIQFGMSKSKDILFLLFSPHVRDPSSPCCPPSSYITWALFNPQHVDSSSPLANFPGWTEGNFTGKGSTVFIAISSALSLAHSRCSIRLCWMDDCVFFFFFLIPASFCMCVCVCVCVCMFSHSVMSDSLRPHGLVVCQVLLSVEFSRQWYWSELPFPTLGNLPDL